MIKTKKRRMLIRIIRETRKKTHYLIEKLSNGTIESLYKVSDKEKSERQHDAIERDNMMQ